VKHSLTNTSSITDGRMLRSYTVASIESYRSIHNLRLASFHVTKLLQDRFSIVTGRYSMALFDDAFSGWGTTVLIGVGVAIAAPVLFPTVGAVIRPVTKGLIKGGLYIADSLKEIVAEGSEQLSDLVAEVKAERAAAAATATTTGQ
jgi:hypothetical protein